MTTTTTPSPAADNESRHLTGTPGLDEVLDGGLLPGRLYLLEGSPGTGKTTIAMQWLMAGAESGMRGCYITMAETENELRASAVAHGWHLAPGIDLYEVLPPEYLGEDDQQSLLHSSDLELSETIQRIIDKIQDTRPALVVLDSLSEIRLLAQNALRYRRQILALKHFFAKFGATVLMLDDMTIEGNDKTVHSIAHSVIRLEELAPQYGAERRRLRVIKYRGSSFRGGFHDFTLARGGATVYPRLRSSEHRGTFERTLLGSGIEALDSLLGGGMERGSSALLLGPAGSGKSLLALHFAVEAVRRGERAAILVFDEELGLLFDRAKGVGIDLPKLREEGRLLIEQVDAAELSPGEFAQRVRRFVDEQGARTVVIDSLNGYQAAMPEELFLQLHIHELLQYLNRQGATTFLTVAQHGLVGDMSAPVDVTYLADTVVLLRYFEAGGRVRRAMSVIKKRAGKHEDTIREYGISAEGLSVGNALAEFQGVLRGVPVFSGEGAALLGAGPGSGFRK